MANTESKIKVNIETTLLVTGGCGFIGSHFINHIYYKTNYNIINFDAMYYCASETNVKQEIRDDYKRYKLIKGNLCSYDLVNHVINDYNINYVIHFAAQSHVQNSFEDSLQYTKDNILGTHTLLEICRKYGKIKKFIHVSTDEVYGESMLPTQCIKNVETIENGLCPILCTKNVQNIDNGLCPTQCTKNEQNIDNDLCPTQCTKNVQNIENIELRVSSNTLGEDKKTEESILCPTNPYAATKAGAELIAQSYYHSFKLPIIITRGNNVYGPNQYPEKLIPRFIKLLNDNNKVTIQGDGSNIRAFLHVNDVVKAFELILEKGEIGEIYNIGSDEEQEYTVMDVAKLLIKKIKNDNNYSQYITYIDDRPFNDKRYYISNEKIKNLGWTINIDFETGINEMTK
jgi:dTDP-D-glucose 4,6-dehydratase